MSTTRRGFLGLLGALGASSTFGLSPSVAKAASAAPEMPKGKILLLGPGGAYHRLGIKNFLNDPGHESSVFIELDLETGGTRASWVGMAGGHHALPLTDQRRVCIAHHKTDSVILDTHLVVEKRLEAPEGYLYSGHGLVLPAKNVFLAPMRRAKADKLTDTGMVEVYDIKSLKLIERVDTGGIHPHEMRLLPGGKEFVVTHYGDFTGRMPGDPREFKMAEPKLTVLDAATLKPVRHHVQPEDAILTHMDIGSDGMVYAVMNQNLWRRGDVTADQILKFYEERAGRIDYDFSPVDLDREQISLPLPTVRINPANGERQIFFTHPAIQRRATSVAAVPQAGKVFATYTHSDTLQVIDTDGNVNMLFAMDFGISRLRGVAAIENSPFVALTGEECGVAIVDARTLNVVRRFNVKNFGAVHAAYAPA